MCKYIDYIYICVCVLCMYTIYKCLHLYVCMSTVYTFLCARNSGETQWGLKWFEPVGGGGCRFEMKNHLQPGGPETSSA